jgi:hypothetical protein
MYSTHNAALHRTPLSDGTVMPERMRRPDLEADLAAAVPQVEKTPEPLCGAAGLAAETASALHRVDKQLVAAQEDGPWGTDPAVQDQPAVQAKRRRCAARRCHWSGDAGPACAVLVQRRRFAAKNRLWICNANFFFYYILYS